jgi:RsiW-degrading membrane proteinase PrsW (M82 family)
MKNNKKKLQFKPGDLLFISNKVYGDENIGYYIVVSVKKEDGWGDEEITQVVINRPWYSMISHFCFCSSKYKSSTSIIATQTQKFAESIINL